MLTGVWSREEEDDGRDAEDNGGTPDECKRERNAVVLKWLSFLCLFHSLCVCLPQCACLPICMRLYISLSILGAFVSFALVCVFARERLCLVSVS